MEEDTPGHGLSVVWLWVGGQVQGHNPWGRNLPQTEITTELNLETGGLDILL